MHRKLRTSKDEIVDRIMMPFLTKATYLKALVEPSSYTPRLGITAMKFGALQHNADVAKSREKTHNTLSQDNAISIVSSSSKEMLVAFNMIS